jgi:hypothetical protein
VIEQSSMFKGKKLGTPGDSGRIAFAVQAEKKILARRIHLSGV